MYLYKVKVNPKMLVWAREDAGYQLDELPKYLSKVELWETGKDQPTWIQLRKLANKYHRPSGFFLRSKLPHKDKEDIKDYRAFNESHLYESPELRLEIRKAKYRRSAVLEIHNEMGIPIPPFSKYIFKSKNPKEVATRMREALNKSVKTQKGWIKSLSNNKKDYAHSRFLYEWKEAVSDLGVLVFETEKVEKTEISGLSLHRSEYPIILLNGREPINRRIFTLFHELAHLMLGESAICDSSEQNKREVFCNKVAGEFLVPSDHLFKELIITKKENKKWNNKELSSLSHNYGVSKQSMLLRLHSLNLIEKNNFKSLYKLFKKKEKEAEENKMNRKQSGYIAPVAKKVKYEGKFYCRLILSAYEKNIINHVAFSRYMNLQIIDIPKLIDKIY